MVREDHAKGRGESPSIFQSVNGKEWGQHLQSASWRWKPGTSTSTYFQGEDPFLGSASGAILDMRVIRGSVKIEVVITGSGVEPAIPHFWQAPRWSGCCQSTDYTPGAEQWGQPTFSAKHQIVRILGLFRPCCRTGSLTPWKEPQTVHTRMDVFL